MSIAAFSPQRHRDPSTFPRQAWKCIFLFPRSAWERIWQLFFMLLVLFMAGNSYGATPAGTIIRSQAQATFLDLYGERQQATSNEVQTLIQAAPGVRLEPKEQTRLAVVGQEFTFPHVLTNTGNIRARYALSAGTWSIYKDAQNTGQIKDNDKIDKPVELAAGESFYFIVGGTAPKEKTKIKVTARVDGSERCPADSSEQGRCVDNSTDSLEIGKGIVYSLTKEMSKETASARDPKPLDVILYYQRLDEKKSTSDFLVTDDLPLAMEFTETEKRVELCDSEGEDCRELKRLDAISSGKEGYSVEKVSINGGQRVSVQLVDQPHGIKGLIRFKARVKAGFGGQTVFNEAKFKAKETSEPKWGAEQTSNRVPLIITGKGVTINGSRYSSAKDLGEPVAPEEGAIAKLGGELTFINYLWNTGTEKSSYTVSLVTVDNGFPENTKFSLESDTISPMRGEKNEQLKITVDDLIPGEFKKILLKVKLPESIEIESDKKGYEAKLKAEVTGNSAVTDEVVNKLPFISDNRASVDLTLGSALQTDKNAAGLGSDTDPEAKSAIIQADGTVIIDKVFVNNTGGVADSYNLSFTGKALPDGFNLTFYDAENNVPLANTGVVAAGGKGKDKKSYKELKLKVSVPVGTTPDKYEFTIKALSPVTGAEDTLPLSVEVVKKSGLTLEPNGEAQVMPGSFITFAHRLTNTGNTNITDITLSWSDSSEGKGWQSVVYRREQASEKDNIDGSADLLSSDEIIQSGTSLAVDPGKTTILIVKVFAPANAMQGAKNITEVKASWVDDNGVNELIVTDTATVNNTNVVIIKKQAAWDCKSDPLKGRQFITTQFPVKPGHCVVYKLTATNRGAETVSHVVIHDAAPNFTVFVKKYGLPKTDNVSSKLYDDDGRIIKAEWSELSPGASVSLYFGIQIQ